MSLFNPQKSRESRFAWCARTSEAPLTAGDLDAAMGRLGARGGAPRWVVVYSAGQREPHERDRLEKLLKSAVWPGAEWVNLLWVVRRSKEMTTAIKAHRNVVFCKDRIQVRRSLEALEWEFDIRRPPALRSHSNCYADGQPGEMQVLKLSAKLAANSITAKEENTLRRYCIQDVRSMFAIARRCERGLFSPRQRARRASKE